MTATKRSSKPNHSVRKGIFLCIVTTAVLATNLASAMPYHGCTFYRPDLRSAAFSGATPNAGCADFSAVKGRSGCTKTKGVCPLCVTYAGDHVQMWLPDYFIEVTQRFGESVFANEADGVSLKAQLKLAERWFQSVVPTARKFSFSGTHSSASRQTLWQARILTIPYGTLANNFPPLSASKGAGVPLCFSGISEFMPSQWHLNLSDVSLAAAYSGVGLNACLMPAGASSMAGFDAASRAVRNFSGFGVSVPSTGIDAACANPVGALEGQLKNLSPGSDAIAPVLNPTSAPRRLCMGSWGNLLPRTGLALSEDPAMAALMSAYRFQSAAADFHVNSEVRMRDDDKWQIVYPPVQPASCFTPGEPFGVLSLPKLESAESKSFEEFKFGSSKKPAYYLIAVWRRRSSCEEPLEAFAGWSTAYKANYQKNSAICASFTGGTP